MKALTEKLIHYTALILITVFAVVVMWKISSKSDIAGRKDQAPLRSLAVVAEVKAPVAVEPLQVELCEITSTYAGKIQPWETYQVGFEIGGRVLALGENATGNPLDVGDRVELGQVLAYLDDRVARARRSEAAARVEQATSDVQRAERVRQSNTSAVSESELQSLVTELAMAKAQFDVAAKTLEDSTLISPVTGTISKRFLKAGESVAANQIVFELVENDDVRLVLDVPESHIRTLELRQSAVRANAASASHDSDPEDRVFRAHVHLEARDSFGNPWPAIDGEVYRIAEVADARTSLFPIEIRLPNKDGKLRPGMVATADVVTARVPGYSIPEEAVLFRARQAHLFTVERDRAEMEILFWDVGSAEILRAKRVDISQWVDQGPRIVVPASAVELDSVVVRGHFRLADGQLVRDVNATGIGRGRATTAVLVKPSMQATGAPEESL